MNPSVFCFLLTFCFLPSLLGGYNEPQCLLFSAHFLLSAFIIGRDCLHAANEHLLLHSHTYRLCVDHCFTQPFLTIGRFGASLCV